MSALTDKKKVVIDCDTGVDDAVAILLSLKRLDVLGITTVAGNVQLEYTQKNTRYVCQTAGRMDVPVYAGYPKPLIVPLFDAAYVHGTKGLGPVEVPEPGKKLEERHAVDFLIDTFMKSDDVTLITLGPLTNIAGALLKEPRLAARIPQIVCMGGSTAYGNVTPAAEFNIYVDPDAARIVFESGIPIRMMGLNAIRQQTITPDIIEAIEGIDNDAARLAFKLCSFVEGKGGRNSLCDACAVMWLIDENFVTKSALMHVVIETRGEYTRGMTVCDTRPFKSKKACADIWHERLIVPLPPEKEPNITVALEIDEQLFNIQLIATLKSYCDVL